MAMVRHLCCQEVGGAGPGLSSIADNPTEVAEVVLERVTALDPNKVLKVPDLVEARQENRVIEKLKGEILDEGFQRILAQVVVHKGDNAAGVASCHCWCGSEFLLAVELGEARGQQEQPREQQGYQMTLCRRCSTPPAVAQSYGSR